MVTSTNQNRQFYVANASKAATADLTDKGDLKVKTVGTIDKEMYFEVLGADTVLKSDRIPVKNIAYAKAVKASAMADKMKKVVVALDSSLVSSSKLLYTEDYVLRIAFRQFYGMSDEDQYFKDAVVRGTAGMTTTAFYAAMVTALNNSFSREVGATTTSNPYLTFSSDASGITIEEKAQPWTLGVQAQERVYFEVVPTTIYNVAVGDVTWGTATAQTTGLTEVGNGKKIADLEYFLLGERGDQYRKIGWPNDIETVGLVDASTDYDVLELHYAFTDTGVNSYKSEKDITIAAPTSAAHTVINAVIAAINSALSGTVNWTVATLTSDSAGE